jgi:predicted nucleic acid-binding Zn ribbon protein
MREPRPQRNRAFTIFSLVIIAMLIISMVLSSVVSLAGGPQ